MVCRPGVHGRVAVGARGLTILRVVLLLLQAAMAHGWRS